MSGRRLPLAACLVDLDALEVVREGGRLALTPLEAKLLEHLAAQAGRVVPREELLVEVWGYRPGVKSRAVDNTVSRLRTKIEVDATAPASLLSAQGAGYRLVLAAAAPARPRAPGLAPPPALVGRDVLLAELLAALRPPGAWLTLHGPGGAGKTSLALAVAHALPEAAEVVWVDATGLTRAEEVLAALLAALGLPKEGGWAQAREAVGAREALVVLDNLDDVAPELAADLPGALGRGRWLGTSRVPVGPEQVVPVAGLAEADALLLYTRLAAGAPADALPELLSRLDHLPLAIHLAAARAAVLPPRRLLERLDRDLLRGGAGRHSSLWATIRSSLDPLSPPLRAALERLAALPGPFDLDLAEAAGVEPEELEELVRRALLVADPPTDGAGVFRMFDQVRACVAAEAPPPSPEAAPWRGLRRLWLARAVRWEQALGGPGEAELRPRLARERAVLAATVAHTPDPDEACRLALLLDHSFAATGPVRERLTRLDALTPTEPALRTAAGLRRAQALADVGRTEEALALARDLHTDGGGVEAALLAHRLAASTGRFDEAEALLDAAGPSTDPRCAAERADWLRRRGRAAEARAAYLAVLPVLVAAGPSRREAELRVGLSQVTTGPAELPAAAVHLDRAAEIFRQLGDRRGEQAARTSLGLLRFRMADWEGARAALRAAAEGARTLGQVGPAAVVLSHLGMVAVAEGRAAEAERLFAEALSAHETAGRAGQAGLCLANLAAQRMAQGRLAEAAALYEEAVARLAGHVSERALDGVRAHAAIAALRLGRPAPPLTATGDPYALAAFEVARLWGLARGDRAARAEARAGAAALRRGAPHWEPWVGHFVGALLAPLDEELARRG